MKNLFIVFFAIFFFSGCATYSNYYKLDEQYLARRQLETRFFETKDEELLLNSSAQVLQDLGFTLDESETSLGLITANKDREAGSAGQKAGAIAIAVVAAVLGGNAQPVYDVQQKIYVTLVSTKSNMNSGYNVRVEFARIIWNNLNQARAEKISDEDIYKDFFDKLSQSVFLTAQNI